MPSDFLPAQSAAVLAAYAKGMGVPGESFSSEGLILGERPSHAPWPYLALVVSCPGGTVLSVAPEMIAFAEANLPERPFQAAQAEFLRKLASAAEGIRGRASVDGPNICWALCTDPVPRELPPGLRLESKDAAWMNAFLASGEFPNGIGVTGVNARDVRNRYAAVIVDKDGSPVAVAGAFDTFGLTEVGIDVAAARQGEGLGIAAVAALTGEILARGETPLYGCAATNIRSQRTAHAAGYVPVFSDAVIDG